MRVCVGSVSSLADFVGCAALQELYLRKNEARACGHAGRRRRCERECTLAAHESRSFLPHAAQQ
jgi:hypothetical protein